jgi:hypothetical protein
LRLGLEIGQVGFELGDLLGLALEPSLESLVLALAAVATRTTATPTAAPTATASRVAIMVMSAVLLVAAIAFAVMPVMMFVVFVSLVGRHAQPSLSSQPVSDALKLLPAANFKRFLPCSGVGVGLAPRARGPTSRSLLGSWPGSRVSPGRRVDTARHHR